MITLTTDRLVIRDHLPGDLNGMHRLLSDTKAMYYLDGIRTRTMDETRRNLEAALAENARPDREKYFFAILEKGTGAYIGEIGFTVKVKPPEGREGCVVDLGYFLLPKFHGRGFATEAARAMLRFAFEEIGAVKVKTGCIRDNAASEAVMKKLGMKKEADFRLHVWHDGRYKDRVEYGLLKEEWVKMQQHSIDSEGKA